jgi:hypothetical protein
MTTYPIDIRRCRHIRTNGTQCGSPALKAKELCFYHQQNQPEQVELYLDGERYSDGQIIIPVFEDAHSIQIVIRQVVQLMLSRRIDRKDAGILLYALQIASGNLKTMRAERAAKPTEMIVEPEKASDTPLGMTPWSATGQGHDPEEPHAMENDAAENSGEETEEPNSPAPPPSPDEFYAALSVEQRGAMRKDFEKKGLVSESEFQEYLFCDAPDPLLLAITRLCADRDRNQHPESATPQPPNPQDLPETLKTL